MNITLRSGQSMPKIGFGTYKIRGYRQIRECLEQALVNCGYGVIDTAAVYGNESDIGAALRELQLCRQNVFITSKLAPRDQGRLSAERAIQQSLANLDTTYLDLYLIHWPGVQRVDPRSDENKKLRHESWKVLEEHHDKGILKSIGVSNFEIPHLEELLAECKVVPHVNQIELHPFYQQKDLVQYCADHGIHVTAYSTLGTTPSNDSEEKPLLDNAEVAQVAANCARTPAQVLLKWALQKGFSVLPKSTNKDHIHQNIDMNFDISAADMARLDSLEKGEKLAWNPKIVK